MIYSETLASLTPTDAGHWHAEVGDDWLQGRSVFGGLQAALAVRAMRLILPANLPLRTLQTTFIGPLPAGRVVVEARLLRVGKTTIHAEARLIDGEQLACLVIAVFGSARPSQIVIEPPPANSRAAELCRELPYIAGLAPAFLQHLRMRWAEGAFPFGGGSEARTRVWVELRNEPLITESVAIALADSIPSPALSLLRKPAPASSLTWSLEFLGLPLDTATAPWLMDAEICGGRDGYLSQTATLSNENGQAVAFSRQSVVVFG